MNLVTRESGVAMLRILNGQAEVPGGDWVLTAMDPQGAAFGLHAKKVG